MIRIKKFVVNPFGENSYVLSDETMEALVVDAGFYFQEEREQLIHYLTENGLKPVRLVNTHCHFDHVMGVDFIRQKFGIPFECHAEDAFWLTLASAQSRSFGISMENPAAADGTITEGESVMFGRSPLRIIHVPGHSPGHVAFYAEQEHFLLAGDVLFSGGIGRSDLPGGNYARLMQSITEKLLVLPPETTVYSGHGTETSVGWEKTHNPYLI